MPGQTCRARGRPRARSETLEPRHVPDRVGGRARRRLAGRTRVRAAGRGLWCARADRALGRDGADPSWLRPSSRNRGGGCRARAPPEVSAQGALRGPHRVQHPIGAPFEWDWLASKGADRSTPLGPGIRPAFMVGDPQHLDLRLWVNGKLKQEANTSDMVVGVAALIAAASELVTLEPGDVIATGTPDGVGLPRGEFLHPGDLVEMEVADFGRLTNPVVVETS